MICAPAHQRESASHGRDAAPCHLRGGPSDANTIGFHLGTKFNTIDLDLQDLSWETAFRVEVEVNRVVWDNRPVTISYVTHNDLKSIPLRKPPVVTGNILIQVRYQRILDLTNATLID